MTTLPRVAVTIGDPTGIGPEIVLKAAAEPRVRALCVPVVYGDPAQLREVMGVCGTAPEIRIIAGPAQAVGAPGVLDVIPFDGAAPGTYAKGDATATTAAYAGRCLEAAIADAKADKVHSVVVGPLCKRAMNEAGYRFSGLRETVNAMIGSDDNILLTLGRTYNLARVTVHVPLSKVPALCTKDRVLGAIRLMDRGMKSIGYARPRIGVSGLNPHIGEGGLLGREEIDEIIPAVEAARAEDIEALGPYPSDTIFFKQRDGEIDAILSMFHDHGNACIKLVEFGTLVNFLAGAPVRVFWVMHGTAFDIAGRGVADEANMICSVCAGAGAAIPDWVKPKWSD